jgi:hypothetical protein
MLKLKTDLFTLAEKQLQKEKLKGEIPCYTTLDVIEYAIKIRKFIDDNPRKINRAIKLTREELKINNRASRKRCYLKYGR